MTKVEIRLPEQDAQWYNALSEQERVAVEAKITKLLLSQRVMGHVRAIQDHARAQGLTDIMAEEIMKEVLAED